jgi:hypothetical protein
MLRLCFTNETKFVRVHELDWKTTLGKVVAMPSVEGMSVKEMKEELATLGSSAEGCCERSEIEEKLRQVRQAKGGHGPAAAAGAPAPAVAGMEQFMASMTASFNTMGDSFGNMVCARLSFPRAPCSVMRKCRTK